jgi:hypothetical protein
MAKITLVIEDVGEHTVSVGGEFPKDTGPDALTPAEELALLLGQLIDVCNAKPKAFKWIQDVVGDAATQAGEPVMGVMSSEDFDAAMNARRRATRRIKPQMKRRRDN